MDEKKPDPRNNGIPFNSETGSKAGKRAKGIPKFQLKTVAKNLLNESANPEIVKQIKKRFNIPDDISNGEAFLRICFIKGVSKGDIAVLAKIAEMAGQFEQAPTIPVSPTINIAFNQSEPKGK